MVCELKTQAARVDNLAKDVQRFRNDDLDESACALADRVDKLGERMDHLVVFLNRMPGPFCIGVSSKADGNLLERVAQLGVRAALLERLPTGLPSSFRADLNSKADKTENNRNGKGTRVS